LYNPFLKKSLKKVAAAAYLSAIRVSRLFFTSRLLKNGQYAEKDLLGLYGERFLE
jgi:hypothetical protein